MLISAPPFSPIYSAGCEERVWRSGLEGGHVRGRRGLKGDFLGAQFPEGALGTRDKARRHALTSHADVMRTWSC